MLIPDDESLSLSSRAAEEMYVAQTRPSTATYPGPSTMELQPTASDPVPGSVDEQDEDHEHGFGSYDLDAVKSHSSQRQNAHDLVLQHNVSVAIHDADGMRMKINTSREGGLDTGGLRFVSSASAASSGVIADEDIDVYDIQYVFVAH